MSAAAPYPAAPYPAIVSSAPGHDHGARFRAHHDALLDQGRCGTCAELVDKVDVLRARACRTCGALLRPHGGASISARIEERSRGWRIGAAIGVGVANAIAAIVPMVSSLVTAAALLAANVFVLRAALAWLPFGRRLALRVSLKLLFAALVCFSLVLNVIVAPFFGVGSLVLGGWGVAAFVVYVEAGNALARRRIEREARGEGMSFGEWAIPSVLVVALTGLSAAIVALPLYAIDRLASAEIPSPGAITRAILEP
jgi:hypothetical protein